MAKLSPNFLGTPNVTWRWTAVACSIWFAIWYGVQFSEFGVAIENHLSTPIDFAVRDAFGKSVTIDERLKIYMFDDSTLAATGSPALPAKDLTAILTSLVKVKPRAIVLDWLFSIAVSPPGEKLHISSHLAKSEVPIIAGAFLTPNKIMNRTPLDLSRPEFDLKLLSRKQESSSSESKISNLGPNVPLIAYGPSRFYGSLFTHIGHINIGDSAKVAAFIPVGEDRAVLQLAFLAAQEKYFDAGRFYADGNVVPLDDDGLLTLNFSTPDEYYKKAKSLKGLLLKARAGEASSLVQQGDIVLLIPQAFTGGTDWKPSPFGPIPGGFYQAAVLNSLLTGDWLKPVLARRALLFASCLIGGILAFGTEYLAFWLALGSLLTVWISFSLYLFSFHGIMVPWCYPSLALLSVSITIFAEKSRVREKKAKLLETAFEGLVTPGSLKHFRKSPDSIDLEARERVVTLMFIDVVGFSLLAENQIPRVAFADLKSLLIAVVGSIVDGARKAQWVKEVCAKEKISLDSIVVVGDGANDLAMLRLAGMRVGYRPKPILYQDLHGCLGLGDHRFLGDLFFSAK